jgi:hypothetical protein
MSKLALTAFLLAAGGLAAADSSRPPPHPRKPPQVAIDACGNAKQGDACSFTLRDREIAGTCQPSPDDKAELACRPEHGPPRPPGGGSGGPPPGGPDEPPPPR